MNMFDVHLNDARLAWSVSSTRCESSSDYRWSSTAMSVIMIDSGFVTEGSRRPSKRSSKWSEGASFPQFVSLNLTSAGSTTTQTIPDAVAPPDGAGGMDGER